MPRRSGTESIWSAINDLGVSRIGHGTSAIKDEVLMDYLRDNRIPLEICPTSNVITGKYVKKIKNHPLKEYFLRGIIVTINTDDPVLFNVELTDELMNLCLHLGFKFSDIIEIIKNNLYASFLSKAQKNEYWENFKIEAIRIINKSFKLGNDKENPAIQPLAKKKEMPLNHSLSR